MTDWSYWEWDVGVKRWGRAHECPAYLNFKFPGLIILGVAFRVFSSVRVSR